MESKELIRAGKLSEARKQLAEEVKASPADRDKRTLLFQVSAILGEWNKAESHLDVLLASKPGGDTGIQVYKNIIRAEKERREIFQDGRRPSLLPEAPPYFETYRSACQMLNEKKTEEAKGLFDRIETRLPVVSGTVNGKVFTGFSDTDTVLSLFLEVIVHERYVWIPFECVRELSITAPRNLLDVIWVMARITTWKGLTLNCFLPVLYPDSCLHEDDRIKLGRMTDWVSLDGQFSKGLGQHVYRIGEEEIPLLEIRDIVFNRAGVEN